MSLRILLADDHRLLRESLRSLIDVQPGLVVVGDAADGLDAVTQARSLRPDVVLMDISMPGLDGIEATRQIVEGGAPIHVIALSMHRDVRTIGEMFAAGARAYLLKDCSADVLLQALQTVAGGGWYVDPELADAVLDLSTRRDGDAPRSILTPREREVLRLLVETGSTSETARALGLSPKTVETHRRNIKRKLGISHMPGLTKYAIREGLTPLDE